MGWRLPLLLGLCCLLVGAASTLAGASPARPQIAGGQIVAQPQDAPWSVLLNMLSSTELGACTGSIVDATHVVTAAHCTSQSDGTPFPTDGYYVAAGIVATGAGADTSHEQFAGVSAVRVHPGYGPYDDVAQLTLDAPLDLSDAAVQPIALATSAPAVGSTVRLYGWGQVTPGHVDRHEHWLDQQVQRPFRCLTGVPSLLCAQVSSGTSCLGDSGGGLVTRDVPPHLLGVLDWGIGAGCLAGDLSGYTDLTSPEIAQWLAGADDPPRAPRAGAGATLSGDTNVGGTATCASPVWTGAPTATYDFLDATSGELLQHGPSDYRLTAADVDRSLGCISIAANAGGTTEAASGSTVTIAPPLDPRLRLRIGGHGKMRIGDAADVNLRLHLSFANRRGHVVRSLVFSDLRPPRRAPKLAHARYRVCLASDAQGVYGSAQVCASWTAPRRPRPRARHRHRHRHR